ncbi:MAG: crossover junction endodeoxyribonuclease RuvC [Deltaproteobacteria bacterium]|nr:crossover junction endodeoxyribonuclease RuvC [Deltaproteobacteria bacterium]
MRIIGIDPGSVITGYGVVERQGNRLRHIDNGVIRPRTVATYPARLAHIYDALRACVAQFSPDALAIEEVFVAKNVRSALHLGQARGIALLVAAQSNLTITEYSTRTVKQSVVGNGAATKEQVQYMVTKLLALPEPPSPDAADALAVAIAHAYHLRG